MAAFNKLRSNRPKYYERDRNREIEQFFRREFGNYCFRNITGKSIDNEPVHSISNNGVGFQEETFWYPREIYKNSRMMDGFWWKTSYLLMNINIFGPNNLVFIVKYRGENVMILSGWGGKVDLY